MASFKNKEQEIAAARALAASGGSISSARKFKREQQTGAGYTAPTVGNPLDNLAVYQQELTDAQKLQKAEGTQRFFNEHPVVAGALEGFSPISLRQTVGQQTGFDIKAPESTAYKAANVGGAIASFVAPYAAFGKAATSGAKIASASEKLGSALEGAKLASAVGRKYLTRAGRRLGMEGAELAQRLGYNSIDEAATAFSKQASKELGERAVRSLAADVTIGAPLNALQAAKEEGSAKDRLRSFLLNEVLDLGAGVGMEALGLTLKSGKKILSEADIDALSPAEVKEVTQLFLPEPARALPAPAGGAPQWSNDAFADAFGLPAPRRNITTRPLASVQTRRSLEDAISETTAQGSTGTIVTPTREAPALPMPAERVEPAGAIGFKRTAIEEVPYEADEIMGSPARGIADTFNRIALPAIAENKTPAQYARERIAFYEGNEEGATIKSLSRLIRQYMDDVPGGQGAEWKPKNQGDAWKYYDDPNANPVGATGKPESLGSYGVDGWTIESHNPDWYVFLGSKKQSKKSLDKAANDWARRLFEGDSNVPRDVQQLAYSYPELDRAIYEYQAAKTAQGLFEQYGDDIAFAGVNGDNLTLEKGQIFQKPVASDEARYAYAQGQAEYPYVQYGEQTQGSLPANGTFEGAGTRANPQEVLARMTTEGNQRFPGSAPRLPVTGERTAPNTITIGEFAGGSFPENRFASNAIFGGRPAQGEISAARASMGKSVAPSADIPPAVGNADAVWDFRHGDLGALKPGDYDYEYKDAIEAALREKSTREGTPLDQTKLDKNELFYVTGRMPSDTMFYYDLERNGHDVFELLSSDAERTLSMLQDFVHDGTVTSKAMADEVSDAIKNGTLNRDRALEMVENAMRRDGKEMPEWYRRQYHPTEAERKADIEADKRYQKETEKYEQANAKAQARRRERDLGADTNKTVREDGAQKTAADYAAERGVFDGSEVPKSTPYGDTQKHAATITTGGVFSKEANDYVLFDVSEGVYGKHTQKNATAMSDANNSIQSFALDNMKGKELSSGRKINGNEKWSDLTINEQDELLKANGALKKAEDEFYRLSGGENKSRAYIYGAKLAQVYDAIGQHRKAADLLADMSILQSEAGRTLQAARLMLANSPLGRENTIRKLAKRISQETGADIKIDDDILKAVRDAKNEQEFMDAMRRARIAIWDQVPASWVDKLNAWRFTAMLGNPRTIVRNEVGNGISYLMRQLKDVYGTGIERAMGVEQGNRTKAILGLGDRKNVEYAASLADERMADLMGDYGKWHDSARPQESKILPGPLQKYADITSQALEEGFDVPLLKNLVRGDRGWLRKTYSNQFAKIMKANGYTIDQIRADDKLLESIHKQAKAAAQEATFRDYNAVASFLSDASRRLYRAGKEGNRLAGATYVGLEATLPFKRTPMNIVKQAYRFSPAGLVGSIVNTARALPKDAPPEAITKWIDDFSAGLAGSTVFGLGMALQHFGLVNVDIGDTKKERNFNKSLGAQENSLNINIGGKDYNYTLDWASPACVPFLSGAMLMQELGDGADLDDALNTLTSVADPIFETTMLQGMQNLVDANNYGDSTKTAEKMAQGAIGLVGSYAGQMIPSLLGAAARTIDPSNYRTNTANEENALLQTAHYNLNKNVISKLPFAREVLAENVNVRGETDRKEGLGDYVISAIENTLSPGYASTKTLEAVDQNLLGLYERVRSQSGDEAAEKVLPYVTTYYDLSANGDERRMTVKERQHFNEVKGKYVYGELERLQRSSEHRQASDAEKAKMVEAIYKKGYDVAKRDYYTSHGMSATDYDFAQLSKALQSGYDGTVPKATYIKAANATNGYKTNIQKAMALSNESDKVAGTLGIKPEKMAAARVLAKSGITADNIPALKSAIDADGNGYIKKSEIRDYANSKDLGKEYYDALVKMFS